MPHIPYEQEFELYHYGESLCAQMVRVALAEKEISYKSHHLLLNEITRNATNLTPEYLAVNPNGIVPTLVHEGVPVYDSWEIIKYLDVVQPTIGPRLWPTDEAVRGETEDWVREAALRDDAAPARTLGTAIPVVSVPIIQACLKRQPFFHVMWKFRKHPKRERAALFRFLRVRSIPKTISDRAVRTIAVSLSRIEDALAKGGPWLFGDFTQIDIMMMAHFHRLEDVHLGEVLRSEDLPFVAAYWTGLQARPSYKTAILDWHEENWRCSIEQVWGETSSPVLAALCTEVADVRKGVLRPAA
ncbi:MAG: hypothetical protein COA62_09830 [Rhodobiaceae bacterium]|nr:MAG: hypothetical protein COA62_09830 [Rhodobiaceae bacterium]